MKLALALVFLKCIMVLWLAEPFKEQRVYDPVTHTYKEKKDVGPSARRHHRGVETRLY